jgi:hypothetical protein
MIIIHDIHVLSLLYINFMYIYIQILPYLYMTTFYKPLTDKQLGCRHIGDDNPLNPVSLTGVVPKGGVYRSGVS